MNDNNNERKIENVEKNEKEEIYDLEMKNLIHSKKKLSRRNTSITFASFIYKNNYTHDVII